MGTRVRRDGQSEVKKVSRGKNPVDLLEPASGRRALCLRRGSACVPTASEAPRADNGYGSRLHTAEVVTTAP